MKNGLWETLIKFEPKKKYPKHFNVCFQNRILNMYIEKKQKQDSIKKENRITKAMSNGTYWAILKRNISIRNGRYFRWEKEVCLVQVATITPSGGIRDHNNSLYKSYDATYYFRKPTQKALRKARKEYL